MDVGEIEIQIQEHNQVEEFLKKFPPDWEAAEKHAEANRVVNTSSTHLYLDKPETYCKCCHLPFPNEDDLYPICSQNIDLGDLGAGFPLFFEFMRYLCFYLFIITAIYFVPVAMNII